jgi:hypothetical protein
MPCIAAFAAVAAVAAVANCRCGTIQEWTHGPQQDRFFVWRIADDVSSATEVGYEMSFTRHFYKPRLLRTLGAISADIRAADKKAEGLLDGLLPTGSRA